MKIKVPDYFLKFKCIADKCDDSCCIGWEIDIDEATLGKYAAMGGEIGTEIREKTQHGYFPLAKNGRCAFLDECGLCRIISAVGDGYLCDICREHPRYYGIGDSTIEGGLGLACPEVARIILGTTEKPHFVTVEATPAYESEDEYAKESDELRELIYTEIYGADAEDIVGRMRSLAKYADDLGFALISGSDMPIYERTCDADISDFVDHAREIFSECEALTEEWAERLEAVRAETVASLIAADASKLRALLYYFTHRYVRERADEMTLGESVLFALYSSLLIFAIADTYEVRSYERAAVLFSKNIEYSTDNVDMVLGELSDLM